MTNASFTDRQTISSTPFSLIVSELWMKPGRCWFEQVGVKAPGSANTTTLRPLKNSPVFTGWGPLSVIFIRVASGILSPALMAI